MKIAFRLSITAIGISALTIFGWFARARPAFQPLDVLRPAIVPLGDLDGDQRADDASVDGSILTLDLSTTAANPEHFLISGEYVTVAAIDVDHDGDLDLVVVSSSPDVVVLVNDGRAGFERRTLPIGVRVGDSLGFLPLGPSIAAGPGAVAQVDPVSTSTHARGWQQRIGPAQLASAPYRGPTSRGPPSVGFRL